MELASEEEMERRRQACINHVPTVWALFKNGYANEDGSIIDPSRVTYYEEESEVRAFASKHGYHNEDYYLIEMEVIKDDYWETVLESIDGTEIQLI